VQAGAERRHHVDAGDAGELLGKVVQVGAADRVGNKVRSGDHLVDGALGKQLSVSDIGDLVTALRSKQEGLPAPTEKPVSRPANVVNLMDALRRSIEEKGAAPKPAKKVEAAAKPKRRAKG
jgi:non-homologous end joining protein Ku